MQRSPLPAVRARHKSVYVLIKSDFDTLVCIPLSKSVTEIRLKILDFVQHMSVTEIRLKILDFVQHIMKMSIFVIK